MNKLYFTLCAFPLLFTLNASAQQCTTSITTPDNDTVCTGSTVTLTGSTIGTISTLNSTMTAGNNHRGNMFDISATNTVIITSFDAHPMANTTIEIYYRPTPYAGFETSSAGWIFVGSAAVIAQPMGTPTPVPVNVNVTIPAGQTYSFYVTSSNQGVSFNYTDGSAEGNVYTSDANIAFREGVGMEYPFTNGTGGVFRPRVWNGVIHYALPGAATYAWSTGDMGFTAYGDVISDTSFVLESTSPGCPTMYDTIYFTAAAPVADAGSDFALCAGDSAALYATVSGFAPLTYSWDNASDSVVFQPSATADYILSVSDYLGCTAADTVNIAVNALPLVNAGNDTMVCADAMLTLSGTGAANYAWDGGITDGVPFTPGMSMTYEVIGTDTNGCSDNDSVTVTVYMVNVSLTTVNETITAMDSSATYQWIDCVTMLPIPGETNRSFTATVNGAYAVIVTDSLCSDTSACSVILSAGIAEQHASGASVYPNPNDGAFTLTTAGVAERIVITDLTGRVIDAFAPQQAQLSLSLDGQDSGVYLIAVTAADHTITTVKVVKQ
jgi:hypothetical protein